MRQPLSSRRSFAAALLCLAAPLGILASIAWSCLKALLWPLSSKSKSTKGIFFRVTQLKNLPVDGLPRRFEIRSDRRDAWNLYANQAVGSVWISRKGSTEVSAWSTSCPHAGCMVQLASNHNHFQCPCHNSRFEINGKRIGPQNPSPRDMDRLEVEIREEEEVWVRFERFKSGISQKQLVSQS